MRGTTQIYEVDISIEIAQSLGKIIDALVSHKVIILRTYNEKWSSKILETKMKLEVNFFKKKIETSKDSGGQDRYLQQMNIKPANVQQLGIPT